MRAVETMGFPVAVRTVAAMAPLLVVGFDAPVAAPIVVRAPSVMTPIRIVRSPAIMTGPLTVRGEAGMAHVAGMPARRRKLSEGIDPRRLADLIDSDIADRGGIVGRQFLLDDPS